MDQAQAPLSQGQYRPWVINLINYHKKWYVPNFKHLSLVLEKKIYKYIVFC